MVIRGTYQRGFTPEDNIECKIKIDKYGIEIYPLDPSLYNKISRPIEKKDYEIKRFVGDKRFTYTWIIEYKGDNNKTQTILTTINKKEYWKTKWIKKGKGFKTIVLSILGFVLISIAGFILNDTYNIVKSHILPKNHPKSTADTTNHGFLKQSVQTSNANNNSDTIKPISLDTMGIN